MLVATSILLFATKNVFYRDNTFVATKMILVADPANDRNVT